MEKPDKNDARVGIVSLLMKRRRLFLWLAGLSLCWLFWWPIWFTMLGGHYIGMSPPGETYSTTRFEFRFGLATRIVEDPHNKMQWVFGGRPDSIAVVNGCRVVVYNTPTGIIKSWGDSMDVQSDSLKHKGYMGIWSYGTQFQIDEHGVVQE